MDNKTLLVRCVTLLYRERHLGMTETSCELVRKYLETLRPSDAGNYSSTEKHEVLKLRDLCIRMCEMPESQKYDEIDFLQQLKTICDDDRVYDALETGIQRPMSLEEATASVAQMRREVGGYFKEAEATKILRDASSAVSFGRDRITNFSRFVGELMDKLEPYSRDDEHKITGLVGFVDLGNTGTLEGALEEAQNIRNGKNVYRTGWQGLNTMLQGGARPGEEYVFGALQHKYKTGLNLSLTRQFIKYNKVEPKKVGGKPTMLRISFEDSLAMNFGFLYDAIYFNEHRRLPDSMPSTKEMVEVCNRELNQNGWHFLLYRINASEWSYRDLFNLVLDLESKGHEILIAMIDYLPMLPTTGCEEGPAGHSLRDLYRRVRGFFSSRDAVTITPHQLSTQAKEMVRMGERDFVKKLVGGGYYAGSKQIDQEVDVEVFQHLEKVGDQTWLTLQRGKHRGMQVIPETHQYMALPFPERGPIPDDLEGECISVRKLQRDGIGDGDGGYQMEDY